MSSTDLKKKNTSNSELLMNVNDGDAGAQPQGNTNMPQYITQVPWYVERNSEPTLKHHSKFYEPQKSDMNNWYERGRKGEQATTFRKGACQNCGAMGHKKRQCAERPRKVGAKYTRKDIAADDIQKEVQLNWQGKRDRWNGYDPDMHKELVEEYEAFQEVKKKKKQEEIEKRAAQGLDIEQDDEYKAVDDPLRVSGLPTRSDEIAKKYHGTINVREREDPPKYLFNLDPNSAAYNPKSRSMNENPNPLLPQEKQRFRGDNYMVDSGDKLSLIEQQKFALQQAELKNSELNSIALPSLTEHLYKFSKRNNQIVNSGKTGELLKRYGGAQHFQSIPEQVAESEAYYEYAQDGRLKRQSEAYGNIRSKYPENVYINDHTSVWGSWWNEYLGWGYHCCHNNVKMSNCMGIKGKELALQKEYKIKKLKMKEQQEAQLAKQAESKEVEP